MRVIRNDRIALARPHTTEQSAALKAAIGDELGCTYVWLEADGPPYLLNEVMIRYGRARDVDYGDRLYADQFPPAVQFAEQWNLGQWAECGGIGAGSAAVSGLAISDSASCLRIRFL